MVIEHVTGENVTLSGRENDCYGMSDEAVRSVGHKDMSFSDLQERGPVFVQSPVRPDKEEIASQDDTGAEPSHCRMDGNAK